MPRLLVHSGRAAIFLALLAALCADSSFLQAAEPQWQEIRSPNFVVITDAGQKRGMEIVLRFEQMRAVFGQLLSRKRVNMPVPLTIFALRDDQRYYAMAPLVDGKPIDAAGFLVPGEDHQFIVLNSMEAEPWRAIAHSFAHLLLNYNYPPTQSWFDEGFAEYFSSIRPEDKQVEIGGDPRAPISGRRSEIPSKPLAELLNSPTWLSLRALLSTRQDSAAEKGVPQPTLFEAQSWITMHYLLTNNKLSETGTYFELVENRRVQAEDAIQQAYGMSAEQFDRAVKEYFRSRMQTDQSASGQSGASLIQRQPAPMGPDDIRITSKPVSEADARAQLGEVMLRLPERREQGLQELKSVLEVKDKHDEPIDNEIAHRGLAWAYMESNSYDKAAEELGTAASLNPQDVWIRYYLSLLKYKAAQANHSEIQGLANMMQDLKATVDWYHDFAEAYYMLAVARLQGGGTGAALEATYAAIGVSPRNEQYQLTLGEIQETAKKWDTAHAIFERLASSHNPEIAAAAQKKLNEFANFRKYGIAGQGLARAPQASPFDELEQEAQKRAQEQPEAGPDKRPTKFMKGRLLRVDCSQAPAAVLTVASGAKSFKLRTPDYKSLLVIGADEFSCSWTDRTVSVNYKPGGTADGDVVSVEVQ
jgi:tetratricopeptide (TPR) repeat protein